MYAPSTTSEYRIVLFVNVYFGNSFSMISFAWFGKSTASLRTRALLTFVSLVLTFGSFRFRHPAFFRLQALRGCGKAHRRAVGGGGFG